MSNQNPQHAESTPPSRRMVSLLRATAGAWMALGNAMHKVMSPLALGVVYFAILTPIALVARLCGHDALSLQRRQLSSYWHDSRRVVASESFRRQY